LVIAADTGQGTVLEDHQHGSDVADLRVWNLDTRGVTATDVFNLLPFSMPYASRYAWDGSGHLAPMEATQAPTSGMPPSGNPDGGASFAPWQPGVVGAVSSVTSQAGILAFLSAFWAWSPDGRSVATSVVVGGQLDVSGVAQPTVDVNLLATHALATVPPPDAALSAIAHEIAVVGVAPSAEVAWSPDGKRLASLMCTSATSARLTVRATASGQVERNAVVPFSATALSAGCGSDMMPLVWSPGGTVIVTSDSATSALSFVPVANAQP
jgi:hypothetical protein